MLKFQNDSCSLVKHVCWVYAAQKDMLDTPYLHMAFALCFYCSQKTENRTAISYV